MWLDLQQIQYVRSRGKRVRGGVILSCVVSSSVSYKNPVLKQTDNHPSKAPVTTECERAVRGRVLKVLKGCEVHFHRYP